MGNCYANDRRLIKSYTQNWWNSIVGFTKLSVIFLVISMKLENKLLFKDSNQYLEKLIGFVGIVILGMAYY